MNLAGEMLRFYVPEPVRRRALRELFECTATAFGAPAPAFDDASADNLLAGYAAFTARHAVAALQDTLMDLALIRERLYFSAYAIGYRLRQELDVTSTADAMAAARAVYGILRIDFRQGASGQVRVERCFFSRFYSPEVCKLMSSLDQGLLAGLSGGGRLQFRQRITEGAPRCLATFTELSP